MLTVTYYGAACTRQHQGLAVASGGNRPQLQRELIGSVLEGMLPQIFAFDEIPIPLPFPCRDLSEPPVTVAKAFPMPPRPSGACFLSDVNLFQDQVSLHQD